MSNFKKALLLRLRFTTVKGLLPVEDTISLPLANLRSMANTIHRKLTSDGDLYAEANSADVNDSLRLDILKEVIEDRVKAAADKVTSKEDAEFNANLDKLINKKKLSVLENTPIADLEKLRR